MSSLMYDKGIITTPNRKYTPHPKGCGYELFVNMIKHKNKVLQIDGLTGEKETYEIVLQKCIRTALKMQFYGVRRGDFISICTLNDLNTCVPFISALFVGAIMAPLDALLPKSESIYLLQQIKYKMIFVSEESLEYIESVLSVIKNPPIVVVFGNETRHISFFEFLQPNVGENDFDPIEVNCEDTAFIYFTSGSTALPKGVCLSHSAFLEQVGVGLCLEPDYERCFEYTNIHWSTAAYYWTLTILTGATKIILAEFDVNGIFSVIKNHKPTYLFLVPYDIATIFQYEVDVKSFSCLRTICIGGASASDSQLLHYRRTFPEVNIVTDYGLTEVGTVIYFQLYTEKQKGFIKTKYNSIGSVINGTSYKVVDVETRETLGPCKAGELLVKTNAVFSKYYNEDSSYAWDDNGWFKTGDVVYYDNDYYFYYVDRIKALIKYQDFHVGPKVIENILLTHPHVQAACVIGVFHEIDEEHPRGIVQLKDGSPLTNIQEELIKLVQRKLENKYHLRGGIVIVKKFPLTPSGKIALRKVKRLYST
ncbi:hypothetical protein FQA39_LY15958 [Lamprigera yunnana]|nr:hypothetical protein FQA39_LY15958 [Lamprigera yunnana]